MKNAIKLTALCLLLSGGLLAAVPSKVTGPKTAPKKDMVMFSPLRAKRGIDVRIRKISPGEAIVRIFDADENIYWKDISKKTAFEKGYILNQLDEGDYTVEVTMPNRQVITRAIHVYDQGDNRCVRISR